MFLTFNQNVSIPIPSGCWPMPHVWYHAVKNEGRDSENRHHRLRVTLVEGIDALVHCCHRTIRVHFRRSLLRRIVVRLTLKVPSLHLVEHVLEGRLEPERLLDLVGAYIRILAVFQEARALVLPHELDERRSVR